MTIGGSLLALYPPVVAAVVAAYPPPQLTLRASLAEYHQSKEHLEKAAKLVTETGYHRRDPEVAELQASLAWMAP